MRDYRPRMKELLVLEGKFPNATVRPPQLGMNPTERDELKRLAIHAGLIQG